MSVPRRPWEPREAVATRRSRLLAISKGAGIAALVLAVVTGATVAGIIGSNQHHGVTPAAAAGLPGSSSAVAPSDAGSSTLAGGTAVVTAPLSSSGGAAVVAVAQPKSQGQPGIVPVPLVPRATAGPIPLLAWQAYHRAAAGSGCQLPWYVLAGIGKIESNHGRYGGAQFDVTGTVHPSIFGPPTAYGRAMGPMQFIPPTWASYAADGNDDDITNPQNIFDATKAAAHYLCKAGGPDLSGLAAQRRAVFAYNHLDSYVADVLAFADAYRHGQPEKVVHLVPIVYPKPAAKVGATTPSHPASSSGAGAPSTGTPTSASPTTGRTTATSGPSTTGTTAPPTTATCVTPPPPTSATLTTSALPSTASEQVSAVPMQTTTAPSTTTPPGSATSPSSTSPTCPPCPTATPTSTAPTPTSAPSGSATACPTTAAPTTAAPTTAALTTRATGQQRTARLTPRS